MTILFTTHDVNLDFQNTFIPLTQTSYESYEAGRVST